MSNPTIKTETVSEFAARKEHHALLEVLDNAGGTLPIEVISLLSDSEPEDDVKDDNYARFQEDAEVAALTHAFEPKDELVLSNKTLLKVIAKQKLSNADLLTRNRALSRKRKRIRSSQLPQIFFQDRLKKAKDFHTWQVSNLQVSHDKELFAEQQKLSVFAKERAMVVANLVKRNCDLETDKKALGIEITALNVKNAATATKLSTSHEIRINLEFAYAVQVGKVSNRDDEIQRLKDQIAELEGAQDDDEESGDSDYVPSESELF
jgi:predicted acyl esterase